MNQKGNETFKEPFLGRVKDALVNAVSITHCEHKIYICLDEVSHQDQIEIGYEMVLVEDKIDALNQLYEWFEDSGALRFISTIENKDTFSSVVGQGDYGDKSNE